MTAGEFAPDLRPLWIVSGADGVAPALDTDGTQRMTARPTRHHLPLVTDRHDRTWFTIGKSWSDESVTYRIWMVGATGWIPKYLFDECGVLAQDTRRRWLLPDGTATVLVDLSAHSDPIGWSIRMLRG